MSLRDEFRLRYGEGKGKRFERDFSLFRAGYDLGVSDSADIISYCPGCQCMTHGEATCSKCGACKVKE